MRFFLNARGRHWAGLLALACALPAGCGSGDDLPREAVSGSVKLDGKPLDKGDIQFFPTGPAENAIATGGQISGGSYSIPQADGLVPGTYKVLISSTGAPPAKGKANQAEEVGDMPGLGPLHAEELIPAKYNNQTELTATVKSGGPNEFDFDLTK